VIRVAKIVWCPVIRRNSQSVDIKIFRIGAILNHSWRKKNHNCLAIIFLTLVYPWNGKKLRFVDSFISLELVAREIRCFYFLRIFSMDHSRDTIKCCFMLFRQIYLLFSQINVYTLVGGVQILSYWGNSKCSCRKAIIAGMILHVFCLTSNT